MIRAITFAVILMFAVPAMAQVPGGPFLPPSGPGSFNRMTDTSHPGKKWFVTKYAGISAGFIGFKGGSSNFLMAPMAWQLNRQLSDNIFAFGGVSVTPYLMNYNNVPFQPMAGKGYNTIRPNNYGINPAARVGVMYTNSERTFSISGSVSVSRGSYNAYMPLYAPVNGYVVP